MDAGYVTALGIGSCREAVALQTAVRLTDRKVFYLNRDRCCFRAGGAKARYGAHQNSLRCKMSERSRLFQSPSPEVERHQYIDYSKYKQIQRQAMVSFYHLLSLYVNASATFYGRRLPGLP